MRFVCFVPFASRIFVSEVFVPWATPTKMSEFRGGALLAVPALRGAAEDAGRRTPLRRAEKENHSGCTSSFRFSCRTVEDLMGMPMKCGEPSCVTSSRLIRPQRTRAACRAEGWCRCCSAESEQPEDDIVRRLGLRG